MPTPRPRPTTLTTWLQLLPLEDRLAPAVYYFNGGSPSFSPFPNGGDPSSWLNSLNWGKDANGTLVVGQGIPGGGDVAVFKGSTEDGKSWTIASGHKDAKGNYDEFADTYGRAASLVGNIAVTTLNIDTTYNNTLLLSGDGSKPASITVQDGRLQSGTFFGPSLINAGTLKIAALVGEQVSFAGPGLDNRGTITITQGALNIGVGTPGGGARGDLLNRAGATINLTGGGKITASGEGYGYFQNDGLVTNTSATNASTFITLSTTNSKTATYQVQSGNLSMTGPNTFDEVRIDTQPDAAIHFGGTVPLGFKGITTFSGGGFVQIRNATAVTLNDAVISTPNGTNLEINGTSDNFRATTTNLQGIGTLAAGSKLAISKAAIQSAFLTNNGTISIAGTTTYPSPQANDVSFYAATLVNNGTLAINEAALSIVDGVIVNKSSGTIRLRSSTSITGGGGTGSVIQNLGMLVAEPTAARSTLFVGFDNIGGTIDVQGSATLAIPSFEGRESQGSITQRGKLFAALGLQPYRVGVNFGGVLNVAPNATLDWRAPELYFFQGSAFGGRFTGSGGGKVWLGGATQMIGADWNLPAGMLHWATDPDRTQNYQYAMYGDWSNSGDLTISSNKPLTPNDSTLAQPSARSPTRARSRSRPGRRSSCRTTTATSAAS